MMIMLIVYYFDVVCWYGMILCDLLLLIEFGCVIVLFGCNGVGKSMLLKIFVGELIGSVVLYGVCVMGDVMLNGELFVCIDVLWFVCLCVVLLQVVQLVFLFSVDEIVLFGCYLYVWCSGVMLYCDCDIVWCVFECVGVDVFVGCDVMMLLGGEFVCVQFVCVFVQLWFDYDMMEFGLCYLLFDELIVVFDFVYQYCLFDIVCVVVCEWQFGVFVIVYDFNFVVWYVDVIVMFVDGMIVVYGVLCDVMMFVYIVQCYGFVVKMVEIGDGMLLVMVFV